MAKKVKPNYVKNAYAIWDEDDSIDEGGYLSFSDGTPESLVSVGESKVVAVYELKGFITVSMEAPKPPQAVVSRLRAKP